MAVTQKPEVYRESEMVPLLDGTELKLYELSIGERLAFLEQSQSDESESVLDVLRVDATLSAQVISWGLLGELSPEMVMDQYGRTAFNAAFKAVLRLSGLGVADSIEDDSVELSSAEKKSDTSAT